MSEPVSKEERPFDQLSREEQIVYMKKHAEEVQKQHPDQDLKIGQEWWAPSVHYGKDLEDGLDKETRGKLDACIAKVFHAMFSPEVMAEAQEEAKVILAEHPKILEQTNALIFDRKEAWEKMRKYVEAQASGGKPVDFGFQSK